jgi:predicted enzyme related to lactoylglutathione lyase
MERVVHFEINADDPERAAKFYGDVFGWKIKKANNQEDYWVINTGPENQPGIDGGITNRISPSASTVDIIDVDSIEKFSSKIEEAGGTCLTPKMVISGVGYMAYCSDSEGNLFGLMQPDNAAQ